MKNDSEKFEPIIIHDWKNDFKGSPARKGKKLAIKHDVVGMKPVSSGAQDNKISIRKHSNKNLIRKPSDNIFEENES